MLKEGRADARRRCRIAGALACAAWNSCWTGDEVLHRRSSQDGKGVLRDMS